jgi:tyramine---L-glutamate ligase
MRRALVAQLSAVEDVRVVMSLDGRLPDEPGPWTIVRVGPRQEESTFARLAAEADATVLVAPETGGILLERAHRIEQVGGRSLGCRPAAIALCGDKALLGHHLARRGITTPRFRVVRTLDDLPANFPFPAVVKPVDGAGAVETFVIGLPGSVPDRVRAMGTALVQPLMVGVPVSASFFVGPDGEAQLVGIGRQNVELKDGQFHYRGGTIPWSGNPPVAEIARRAVESVNGLRGWVGVDLIANAGENTVSVLEINPRVTTSFVGFHHLARRGDLAKAWLTAFESRVRNWSSNLDDDVRFKTGITFLADGTVESEGVVS